MYAQTENRKLSEISRLGRRATLAFRRLDADRKRQVVARLDEVTAERLAAAVAEAGKAAAAGAAAGAEAGAGAGKSLPANNAKGRE